MSRFQQQGLFDEIPAELSGPAEPAKIRRLADTPARRRSASRLWMCLYFPGLSLEALPGGGELPRAVLEGESNAAIILVCDERTRAAGVRPGLSASAALAILPELELIRRDPGREAVLLARLADCAAGFTPSVSLEPPDMLLLEIAGSLRLFAGLDQFRERVLAALHAQGRCVQAAIAPTALAAQWLARAGACVSVQAEVASALARLPLAATAWPAALQRRLREMGVRNLGECSRLPRDGLARRLGPQLLRELDQAYGRMPEVRCWHQPERRFCAELELPVPTSAIGLVAIAVDRLLKQLCAQMQRHQHGSCVLWLRLRHHDVPETLLRIGLLQPVTDPVQLAGLVRMHLETACWPAPVTAICLQAVLNDSLSGSDGDLLDGSAAHHASGKVLLERLRARLGSAAVHGIRALAEHRPEYAWQSVEAPGVAIAAGSLPSAAARPLWILPEPSRLTQATAGLELQSGPERIENGWWDGHDIRRDYFVARDQRGLQLWVFRDLRSDDWYLHGIFG